MSVDTIPHNPAADLGMTAAMLGAFLRRLPPLPDDAPADLTAAADEYLQAADTWYLAEAEHDGCSARLLNARRTEAEAIRVAVLKGEDPTTVADHLAAADRDLRRAHAVAVVRAGEVKKAASRLLTIALAHRDSQLAATRPAIDAAAAQVEEAQAQLRRAQAELGGALEVAAWWDNLSTTNLPDFGTASRVQLQAVTADFQVSNQPIGA